MFTNALHLTCRTIRNELQKKAMVVRKDSVALIGSSYYAATTDGWTSNANETYYSLCVHFIDDWTLRELNLDIQKITGHTTATDVDVHFNELLERNSLDKAKLCCLVTDNEATMNRFGQDCDYEWQGCIDHQIEICTGHAFDSGIIVIVFCD